MWDSDFFDALTDGLFDKEVDQYCKTDLDHGHDPIHIYLSVRDIYTGAAVIDLQPDIEREIQSIKRI